MYRLIFLSVFLASVSVYAQQELSSEYVEQKTLEYFENQQWRELIRLGERGLENGVESYLLRVRLGIAYYELEEFVSAIPHLSKAVQTGYSDGIVKEYLYYSYVFTGRNEDANCIFYEMSENRRSKIRPLVNDFVEHLTGDVGFSFSNDESENGRADIDGPENIYGEQVVNGNQFFFDIRLGQLPVRWFQINYGYAYLNAQREKQFMFGDQKTTARYKQKQGQLFNEFRFRIIEGLVVSPSGHYINTKEKSTFAVYNRTDTVYEFIDSTVEQDNFVISLSAENWFGRIKAGLSGSFSYLNGTHQTQYGLALSLFPLNKPYLYLGASATVHTQNSVSNLIITPAAGARLTEGLWLEAFSSFGKMNNYNELNGLIVYNNPDVITLKYGGGLTYYFPFNLTASLTYAGQSREKKYLTYELSGSVNNEPAYSPAYRTLEYNMNSIVMGLKYNF